MRDFKELTKEEFLASYNDCEDMTRDDVYNKLDRVGFTDSEIDVLGFGFLFDEFHDDEPNTGFEPSVQTIQPIEDDYDLEDCYV